MNKTWVVQVDRIILAIYVGEPRNSLISLYLRPLKDATKVLNVSNTTCGDNTRSHVQNNEIIYFVSGTKKKRFQIALKKMNSTNRSSSIIDWLL